MTISCLTLIAFSDFDACPPLLCLVGQLWGRGRGAASRSIDFEDNFLIYQCANEMVEN